MTMDNKKKNPILDDPCQGWVSTCDGDENCDCCKCSYYRQQKDRLKDKKMKIEDMGDES
jgi:hypothetical protein